MFDFSKTKVCISFVPEDSCSFCGVILFFCLYRAHIIVWRLSDLRVFVSRITGNCRFLWRITVRI